MTKTNKQTFLPKKNDIQATKSVWNDAQLDLSLGNCEFHALKLIIPTLSKTRSKRNSYSLMVRIPSSTITLEDNLAIF